VRLLHDAGLLRLTPYVLVACLSNEVDLNLLALLTDLHSQETFLFHLRQGQDHLVRRNVAHLGHNGACQACQPDGPDGQVSLSSAIARDPVRTPVAVWLASSRNTS
jgi:hypothetical protein